MKQNKEHSTDNEILLADEAAFFLRMSIKTLYDRVQKGQIPGSFVVGEWRFVKTQLIDFMKMDAEAERIKRRENYKLEVLESENGQPVEKKKGRSRRVDVQDLIGAG